MATDKESPSTGFKRVLTVAMKTIAEDPELSVVFGNEQPALSGNRARLPQIANELKASDVAIVRGKAADVAGVLVVVDDLVAVCHEGLQIR